MRSVKPHLRVQIARAQRFQIPGKIRYRTDRERQWLEGRVKDVSKTGVLFLAGHPPKTNSRIDMRLMLSPAKAGEFRVEIACTGQIVRRAAIEGKGTARAVAATIARYRIVQRRKAPQSSIP